MSELSLEARVEALGRLDIEGLRDAWQTRHGDRPAIRSRDILRRMLAFDMQAQLYGGLDAGLRQRLRRCASTAPKKTALQPGTTITREWRGEHHVVHVTDGGFVHEGADYDSLSEIARTITGTRWSGPRFFGVDDLGRKK